MLLLAVSCLVSPALAAASAPAAHGGDDHGESAVKTQAYWDSSLRNFSSEPREG